MATLRDLGRYVLVAVGPVPLLVGLGALLGVIGTLLVQVLWRSWRLYRFCRVHQLDNWTAHRRLTKEQQYAIRKRRRRD